MPKPKKHKRFRSAEDGQFVSKEEAEASPSTTVSETVETPVDPQREYVDGISDSEDIDGKE